jgi:chromosome segregation ATPase
MDTDATDPAQDSPPEAASEEVVQPTPDLGVPKAEVAKLLSDMKAEHGRQLKAIQEEAQGYKGQLDQHKALYDAAQSQLNEAEEQLAKGNEDLVDVVKLRREVRDRAAAVARDEANLAQSRKQNEDVVQSANKALRDLKVLKVVSDKKVDLDKLQGIIGDSEDFDHINRVADILAATVRLQSKPWVSILWRRGVQDRIRRR